MQYVEILFRASSDNMWSFHRNYKKSCYTTRPKANHSLLKHTYKKSTSYFTRHHKTQFADCNLKAIFLSATFGHVGWWSVHLSSKQTKYENCTKYHCR